MSDKPRHWLVAVLVAGSLARLAIGVGEAAASDHSGSGYHPQPNHLGVVVTAHEIFVSWLKPAGADAGTVVVRRGEPACPRSPDEGTTPPRDSPVHVIDRSVTPGHAYCYTVFLESSAGSVTTVGRTGAVSVPNVSAVPPPAARAPAPIMSASSSGFDTKLAKRVSAGALAALAGVLVVLLLYRSARRVSNGRVVIRPTMRESIVGRNSSALVVPTMIALGWIVVVIAFVVLR
jgi:hypothetical protein